MDILLRQLCDLHNVPLPSELDTLLSSPSVESTEPAASGSKPVEQNNAEDINYDDFESDPDSEVDEHLSLDMDMDMEDERKAKKVHYNKDIPNEFLTLFFPLAAREGGNGKLC